MWLWLFWWNIWKNRTNRYDNFVSFQYFSFSVYCSNFLFSFFSCHDTTTTIFDVLFLTYYLLLLYSNLLNLLNVALKMNYRNQKFATTKILTTAILNKLTRCPIQFAIFKKFLSFLYLCLKCFIDVWYSKNKFIYHKICRTPCICFILIVGMTPPNQIYAHKRSLLEKCSICIF